MKQNCGFLLIEHMPFCFVDDLVIMYDKIQHKLFFVSNTLYYIHTKHEFYKLQRSDSGGVNIKKEITFICCSSRSPSFAYMYKHDMIINITL